MIRKLIKILSVVKLRDLIAAFAASYSKLHHWQEAAEMLCKALSTRHVRGQSKVSSVPPSTSYNNAARNAWARRPDIKPSGYG